MKHSASKLAVLLAVAALVLPTAATAQTLDQPVTVYFDEFEVPTVHAQTEHDAIYMQGFMHAKDRFFQMDFQRRQFSGTLSELVGPGAIAADVQLRTLGLRRAAEASLAAQTPETMAWLQAYSDGVNAFIQSPVEPLPIEYTALEIDRGGIPAWTPTDTLVMVKGLAFGLSFSLADIDRTIALLTFLGTCEVLGCNGLQLFQDDLYRVAPFQATLSVPPTPPPPGAPPADSDPPEDEEHPDFYSDPGFETLVQSYRDAISEVPMLDAMAEEDLTERGSNWWIASGAVTDSGFPMLANDPHLALGTPATFYEYHMIVEGGINATGISFPGAPGLVQGCNETICWGSTNNAIDVTDVYQEVLLALDPSQPTTPTHTLFQGQPEPLQFIPQAFFFNNIGDGFPNTLFQADVPADSGGVTFVVPRRNNGPIVQVQFDPAADPPFTGISVQYAGFGATQELEAFRQFTRASSPADFKAALQFFDVGSQNWAYADINGNIAYYTSGELPIREDLQFLFFPDGLISPWLIRDGTNTSRHEWAPLQNPQPNQALPYEILPFSEMPQIENPAAGYIINANNDPVGDTFNNVAWDQFRAFFNGRKYLSSQYAPGFRSGQLQNQMDALLGGGGTVSEAEFIALQGNNQLLDAEVFLPYIQTAYDNAIDPGAAPELAAIVADPRIGEAVSRLSAWSFGTPTGIDQGFDPGDAPGVPGPAQASDADASAAATIYALWRSQVVKRVIDGTLANLPVPLDSFAPGTSQAMSAVRELLENYDLTGGTGRSLINFFQVPGVEDQEVARDIILLQAIGNGLDLLASPEFAPAFGQSTDMSTYNWGKLHRIVFRHPLGGSFDIPPPGSPDNLAADLPGISRAGGLGALDASAHSARADGLNEFMFGSGPSRRVVATMTPDGPMIKQVIPGGQSGEPGSPQQTDQLNLWLVNEYKTMPVSLEDVANNADRAWNIDCGNGSVDPGEQCDDGNVNGNDGCNTVCRVTAIVTCSRPTIAASADTCTATPDDCNVVATCYDPDKGEVEMICASDEQGLGEADISVTCTDDDADVTQVTCFADIVDVTGPNINVVMADSVWPPNHRMTHIAPIVSSDDACGLSTVTMDSVISGEADDMPGMSDGETTDDVSINPPGPGTPPSFSVRAERDAQGSGRQYAITFSAVDAAGNSSQLIEYVDVAIEQDGMTDPLALSVDKSPAGTVLDWSAVAGAEGYHAIRGDLSAIATIGQTYDLGAVSCLEAGSLDTSTAGFEDSANPAPGEAFFYLVEYIAGEGSGYGTESAAKPRVPAAGACQ